MLGASRILEKGPEYLRKQMELEREGKGRASAAERLAATRLRYVKGPQGTSSTSSTEPGPETGSSTQCARGSTESTEPSAPAPEHEENPVMRNSSKKRPDSVLLYRQKCDLQRGAPGANYRRKRTLLKSLRERNNAGAPVSAGQGAASSSDSEHAPGQKDEKEKDDADKDSGPLRRRPERVTVPRRAVEGQGSESERARKVVSRSHSDVSSRYSRSFADFDAFFQYCGLESDVVEALGRGNFSSRSDERELYTKIRSVSMAVSDSEISHTSGDIDGLQEEEVKETRQQGSSVIERNARVIKWLYSCRNASESGKMLRDLN